MKGLDDLDWQEIKRHYEKRIIVSRKLITLANASDEDKFFELAVGISDPFGNFSADEHKLGPSIQAHNLNYAKQVHSLANSFLAATKPALIPNHSCPK